MAEIPPVTILNVEDYFSSRTATTALLQQAGYHVVEAETGLEALQLAASVKPHLILMDVNLPDLNGYEVCQRLKSDPVTSNLPVLQISGSLVEGEDKVRGLESGADSYLLKPVNPAELLATIRALLRIRQAELDVRESEERLRLTLDAAVLGTWDLNVATDQIIWGGHHAAIFGLPPATPEISGAEFLALVHPDDVEELQQAMTRALAEGDNYKLEFRITQATGNVRWVSTQAQVYRDSQGQAIRIVGIVRDVTESRQVEVERERLLEREQAARATAEAATRAKDEFLALVSHELRAPLSSILGWARMLQPRPSGSLPNIATLTHALQVIERNARSQMRLIEDLLDVSRIVSGKLSVKPRPLELGPLIEATCESLRPAAAEKRIDLQCQASSIPDTVFGDPDRLQQVVWNLVSNAIKFTPSEGMIEVRTRQAESQVELTVRDTGNGISPEFLPYVFERFRQDDQSSAQRKGGLGLGLALVKHLVELHGGMVEATSAGEGSGATFTVKLPLANTEDKMPNENQRSWHQPGAAQPSTAYSSLLQGVQVLLVDDDEFARELVTLMLEQEGAHVITVDSVKEAMRRLALLSASELPHVLVSDISMPDEDGYSLIRQIRALPPECGGNLRAVALTAFGRPEDRIRMMTAGFHTHITKPVEQEELIAVVAALAGKFDNNISV